MHSVFKQIQLEIASNSFENSKSFQSRLSLKQNLLKKLCQMNFHVMDRLETSVVMVVGVPGHIDVLARGCTGQPTRNVVISEVALEGAWGRQLLYFNIRVHATKSF